MVARRWKQAIESGEQRFCPEMRSMKAPASRMYVTISTLPLMNAHCRLVSSSGMNSGSGSSTVAPSAMMVATSSAEQCCAAWFRGSSRMRSPGARMCSSRLRSGLGTLKIDRRLVGRSKMMQRSRSRGSARRSRGGVRRWRRWELVRQSTLRSWQGRAFAISRINSLGMGVKEMVRVLVRLRVVKVAMILRSR